MRDLSSDLADMAAKSDAKGMRRKDAKERPSGSQSLALFI